MSLVITRFIVLVAAKSVHQSPTLRSVPAFLYRFTNRATRESIIPVRVVVSGDGIHRQKLRKAWVIDRSNWQHGTDFLTPARFFESLAFTCAQIETLPTEMNMKKYPPEADGGETAKTPSSPSVIGRGGILR